MKVLGRELVAPFDFYWERFGPEIDVPIEHIEVGLSSVFGDQGADLAEPDVPEWAARPDDDLACHVVHELTHIVLRGRGFPKTGHGLQYSDDSAEARIGADLEEMVLHPALESLIEPFGFKNSFIRSRMLTGVRDGVSNSPVPDYGTPWFFVWAIRYTELQLELQDYQWKSVQEVYRARVPEVCDLGEELLAIMRAIGWGTREQALEAMVQTRDTLGLNVDGRVLVIDPVTNQTF